MNEDELKKACLSAVLRNNFGMSYDCSNMVYNMVCERFIDLVNYKSHQETRDIVSLLLRGTPYLPARIFFKMDPSGYTYGLCVPIGSNIVSVYYGDVRVFKVNCITFELIANAYSNNKLAESVLRTVLGACTSGTFNIKPWQVLSLERSFGIDSTILSNEDNIEDFNVEIRKIHDKYCNKSGRPGKQEVRSLVKKPRKRKFSSPF